MRSATSDIWSGVASSATGGLAAAISAGDQPGGASPEAVAGIALLALGLTGFAASALVAVGRRRRRTR